MCVTCRLAANAQHGNNNNERNSDERPSEPERAYRRIDHNNSDHQEGCTRRGLPKRDGPPMQGASPRRNAEPTFIKGEAFWSPDQLEKLVSDTSAEKLGLFVSEDAQPLKTLSFHRGCQIYYLVYRLSDCVKRQSLSPSERKRQRSSRLRAFTRPRKLSDSEKRTRRSLFFEKGGPGWRPGCPRRDSSSGSSSSGK